MAFDNKPNISSTAQNIKDKSCCDECGVINKTLNTIKRHKLRVHIGIKFPCEKCNYVRAGSSIIEEHMNSAHKKLNKVTSVVILSLTSLILYDVKNHFFWEFWVVNLVQTVVFNIFYFDLEVKLKYILSLTQLNSSLSFLYLLSTFLCFGFPRVLKFCKDFEVKRIGLKCLDVKKID